jgi:hypothetical protein
VAAKSESPALAEWALNGKAPPGSLGPDGASFVGEAHEEERRADSVHCPSRPNTRAAAHGGQARVNYSLPLGAATPSSRRVSLGRPTGQGQWHLRRLRPGPDLGARLCASDCPVSRAQRLPSCRTPRATATCSTPRALAFRDPSSARTDCRTAHTTKPSEPFALRMNQDRDIPRGRFTSG